MSKATNQTLLLLSMVHGATKLLIQDGFDRDESVGATLLYADELSQQVIHDYKASGNEQKNFKVIKAHLDTWKSMIDEPSINWPPVVLITMAQNIMEDLLSVIKNPIALDSMTPLAECIRALAKNIEVKSTEDEFTFIFQADALLRKMYDVIEFPYRS